jgi:hypothetical protein
MALGLLCLFYKYMTTIIWLYFVFVIETIELCTLNNSNNEPYISSSSRRVFAICYIIIYDVLYML